MKLKTIIVLLLFSAGALVVLKSVSKTSMDTCKDLLLENIEALAEDGENGFESVDCFSSGSVVCPEGGARVLRVEYFSVRDNVSLY